MPDQKERPVAGCGTLHGDLTRAMLATASSLRAAGSTSSAPVQLATYRRAAGFVFHDHGLPFDEAAYDRARRAAATMRIPSEEAISVEIEEAVASSHVEAAIVSLRCARDRLVRAGAPRATDKVRRALKSAEGALRHAQRRAYDPPALRRHDPEACPFCDEPARRSPEGVLYCTDHGPLEGVLDTTPETTEGARCVRCNTEIMPAGDRTGLWNDEDGNYNCPDPEDETENSLNVHHPNTHWLAEWDDGTAEFFTHAEPLEEMIGAGFLEDWRNSHHSGVIPPRLYGPDGTEYGILRLDVTIAPVGEKEEA